MLPARVRPILLVLALAAAACDEQFPLPPALFTNVIDSVTLYALDGTPVTSPSGFIVEQRAMVRVDRASTLDFAVNIDQNGQALLYPSGALGFNSLSGIKAVSQSFDSLRVAPGDPYERFEAVPVNVGSVLVIQTAPVVCAFSAFLPLYAKVEVTAIDVAQRTFTLRVLANVNCGYRSLETGIPES
jgi:hypothetical protein